MRTRIIMFLIRTKFGLKKHENFRFANQKSNAVYYIADSGVMKHWHGCTTLSSVSLNWLLDKECVIEKV